MKNPATELFSGKSDPFENLLGYHLRRLSVVVMTDLAESLSSLDLRPTSASIVMMIGANPGITQSEVGRALGILRANMAPLIAGLLKQGLIDRKAVDGRSQALRLSAAGRNVCREVSSAMQAHEDRIFGTLARTLRTQMMVQLRELWRQSQLVPVLAE
jgi:DNA-binding MarR family transcriptional regulator